jgi:tRNA dimethylallyltransferase
MVPAQLAPRVSHHDRLAVLCGPTAVGKTAVAVALAQRLHAEILCADSRTVYRGLDIGTAKPDAAQRALVPHHLLDVADPAEAFTVKAFQRLAQAAIEAIRARGCLPLIVGGTGLYIRALVDRLEIPDVAPDEGLRAALEAEARELGPEHLHRRLAGLDAMAAARIHPHNVRRVIRALEVVMLTGRPFSAQQGRHSHHAAVAMVGLIAERAALYRWIDERVDAQLAAGLVDETRALLARGVPASAPAMQSLGYKEMGGWLRGLYPYEEAVRRLKRNTRRYAKRQLTWFGRDPRIRWLEIDWPADARGLAGTAEALAARVHAMMEHEFIAVGRA